MGTTINGQPGEGQEEAVEAKEDQEVEETLDGEDIPEDTSASDNTDDTEEESSDDEDSEEEVVDDEITEKELEGLRSQKERLSSEIVELRKERRGVRKEEKPDVFVETNPLDGVADSDVELIEKVLKSKGYVKKEDQYQSSLESYKDAWLEDHPDYLPDNDPDDVLWNKLNKELNTFYKRPKNPKDIVKLLSRIDKDINPKASIPVKSRAKTEAAKKKIETSSKGGGGKGKSTSTPKTKTTVDRSALSGFTDEELDEMGL
jgi:hypothetical protein